MTHNLLAIKCKFLLVTKLIKRAPSWQGGVYYHKESHPAWSVAVDANGVALGFSSHSRQAAEHYVDRLELIRDCVRAGTQKMGSYWDWALRGGQCPIQLVNVTQVLMMKCERERLKTVEFAAWSLPSLEFYPTLDLLRLRICSQASCSQD